MNITKFFRYVWRINAFIILIVSLAALFVLAWAGWHLFQDQERLRQIERQPPRSTPTALPDEWSLGPFKAVSGTPFLMAPAFATTRDGKSFLQSEVVPIRNYLFLDKSTLNGHWLLPDTRYQFLVTDPVLNAESDASTAATACFIFVGTKVDRADEALFVVVADPDGRRFREILGPIDAYQGYKYGDDGGVLLFYIKDDQYAVAEVDITLQQLSSQRALPRLP